MKKNRVYKIFGGVSVFLLLYAMFLWLFYTNSGLQLVYHYAKGSIPGELNVVGLSGNLAGTINADEVSYQNKRIKFSARNVMLEWRSRDLLFRKVRVNSLKAENVAVAVLPINKGVKDPLKDFFKYNLPRFDLQNISLQQGIFNYPGLKTINVDDFQLSLAGSARRINLIDLQAVSPNINLQIKGKFDGQYDVNWDMSVKNLGDVFSAYSGALNSKGNLSGRALKQLKADMVLQGKNLKFANNEAVDLDSKFITDAEKFDTTHINFSLNNVKLQQKYLVNSVAASGELVIDKKSAETLNLQFLPVNVSSLNEKKTKQLTINSIKLKIIRDKGNVESEFNVTPLDQPALVGKLFINKGKDLNGEFNWNSQNLRFLEIMLPDVQNVVGKVNAVFALKGKVNKPEWSGKFSLQQAGAKIPRVNLNLTNGKFDIDVSPKEVKYAGQIFSGGKALNINGLTKKSTQNYLTEMSIVGDNFLLTDIPSTRIYISPNLKLTVNNKRMELNGSVTVPEAVILSHNLSDVETLPSDVKFTDQEQEVAPEKMVDFYSRINIILGDKIYLDTMGLKGNITGQVLVVGSPQSYPIGKGELLMKQGSYSLYGQNLTIENGRLIFSDTPINNPSLNIRAFRTIETVGSTFSTHANEKTIVGVYILGTLSNIQSTLYSEPSGLSQEDMLSYLLLGQASSKMGEASGTAELDSQVNLMLNAIKTLNIGGSSNKFTALSDGLRKKLGFSQFGLETGAIEGKSQEDNGKSTLSATTSLVLGRYLSPSLYVGYSIGILDQVSIFKIKYNLWRNFIIQTETSSLGTGVDLLYSISRK